MFRNRIDAGIKLADYLSNCPRHFVNPIVLAIPRGGAVVGAVIARLLGAEFDVVLSRKLRAPNQPELAIGAISEFGQIHLDSHGQLLPGVSGGYLAQERRHQLDVITHRKTLYRNVRPQAKITNRSVILTDDGIVTGSTIEAAIQTIKLNQPLEIIVAVPVIPPDRITSIEKICDEVIRFSIPNNFRSIREFYGEFSTVTDEEVCNLLRELNSRSGIAGFSVGTYKR